MQESSDGPRACPIARTLEVVGERWSLLVIREITLGVHRFEGIRAGTGAPRAVLVERLRASVVVVGENFTYGHRAAGTLATLSEAGAREGFEVDGVRLVRSGEQVLSSTAIRARVAEGDVAAAAAALDRPHRVEGVVVHGDARGRTIGYPTANIQVTPWAAVPADGVYAGFACWSGRRQPAAISIGTNPTFEGRDRRVEAFLLDFDEDLYGEYMAYEFTHRLRPTLRFDSVAELVTQMAADVEATRAATLLV